MTPSRAGAVTTDPADLGVVEAAALLRDRQLSSAELTAACLRRIDEVNGGPPTRDGDRSSVNAWIRLYPELAAEDSAAADRRLAEERDQAPLLCGIPIGLKDLYGVAGLPLTASSRVLDGNVAAVDAPVWDRLRRQGMVLLGHTHTHEFAAGGTTDQVGNPWALDRVAGGSSGGSAAAVAAGMTPAALGSDTCGSLRIPSACCGTSAVKPTHGMLPLDGIIPLAPSMDHPGPMARTIADCSAVLNGMLHGGPAVSAVSPPPAPVGKLPVAASPGPRPLSGLTIALTDRTEQTEIEPQIAQALQTAREACEALGARVICAPAPLSVDWDDLSLVLFTESWAYHAEHAPRAGFYRPAIAEFVEVASRFTAAGPYLAAQARRARATASWERWFERREVDLILEPTLPIVPYGRGPGYERGHAGGAGDPMIALTAQWDMTGMPVAALPVTWEASVSLVAPRGGEEVLIGAAIDLQEHGLGVPRWAPPGPRTARVTETIANQAARAGRATADARIGEATTGGSEGT
jgi:aspartyl-tRNA(Asn)/glutamyl-tRNA(Gln) amidotransferase subunit A